ncbi:uncharacterized protein [Cicer arietinum]|uniref:uncharacterized protein n=1 Tax=Cicer arietinum TaxID=3827 RepID=UPI003CC6BE0F
MGPSTGSQNDNGRTLHQLDVKNAFLHGYHTKDIYMTPLQGLFSSSNGVYKLKRSLYELGNSQYFLGLEVHSTSKGIFRHQLQYATYLISMVGIKSANLVDTPLEVIVKYHRDEGDLLTNPLLYRQLMDNLNYINFWMNLDSLKYSRCLSKLTIQVLFKLL